MDKKKGTYTRPLVRPLNITPDSVAESRSPSGSSISPMLDQSQKVGTVRMVGKKGGGFDNDNDLIDMIDNSDKRLAPWSM